MRTAREWLDQNDPAWGDLGGKPELTEAIIKEIQLDAWTQGMREAADIAAIRGDSFSGDQALSASACYSVERRIHEARDRRKTI
jgi:hypothetical protein